MNLDMITMYLEEDAELFDSYMDLLGTNKKSTFTLDYYDNLDYDC